VSGPSVDTVESGDTNSAARIYIRVGDIEIDIAGARKEVDARLLKIKEGEEWSTALSKIRTSREAAITAAVEAARQSGLPERGSAFRTLIESCGLSKKPDQLLAAIHYLRDVEGINDSPPRSIIELFEQTEINPPGNLSLYLNRLRDRGMLTIPPGSPDKNRFAILTPEGRAHLDRQSRS